jgi:transposase
VTTIEETDEAVELVERVCALDIGKATLTACIRVPNETKPGHRRQEVREYATTTRSLLELTDRLRADGVVLVAMEATSSYWKPAFYLLEAEGFTCWLLNAKHVKNVPGRPKTDRLDAVWLAKVVERGMCRPSFVPPRPIRRLRDLTRYRRTLIRERTREKQRVEKLLEDAQIKLSSVVSDVFGVSGRQMLGAMICGQRDPKRLAQLARASMRSKIGQLEEALTGHFDDHHGFLCQMMLERIDDLSTKIEEVTARIDKQIAPFAAQVTRLDEVTGIGPVCAQELIAELGVDMAAFPTHAHLVSWAKFAPQANTSAGKAKTAATGKGNPWLAATLGEIAVTAGRTNTFLGERYRRIAKRRGKKRALVAVGNSVLTIVWHLLADPDAHYQDLGPDYYQSRMNRHRQERNLVRQLEHLTGQKVTLAPRPAQPAA